MSWLLPPSASTYAGDIDFLYYLILVITGIAFVIVEVGLVWFLIKYRRRRGHKPQPVHTSHALELTWTIIPLVICLVMFSWGAGLYVHMQRPPGDAMEIHVIGKQWMWKTQHPTGKSYGLIDVS